MPGRDVDPQVADPAFGHGLQVGTDRVDMNAVYELGLGLEDTPGLFYERLERSTRFLRSHQVQPAELWPGAVRG